MGTHFRVLVRDAGTRVDTARLRARIPALLATLERTFSTYRRDSELSRVNRSMTTDWQSVSLDLFTVLSRSAAISRLSGGAFDITVAPLLRLWGFGPGAPLDPSVPSESAITAARARTGWQNVEIDGSRCRVRKALPGLVLDLNAIAKGYAVEKVGAALAAAGGRRYLVDIGGDISVSGAGPATLEAAPPHGSILRSNRVRIRPWRIGVESPGAAGERPLARLNVRSGAIATSGDYRNFYVAGGHRIPHIVDPATGRPVSHGLASVTVVSARPSIADALATALLVLGPRTGPELADRFGIAALFIERQHSRFRTRWSEAMVPFRAPPGARARPLFTTMPAACTP